MTGPAPPEATLRERFATLSGTLGVWTHAGDGLDPGAAGEMAAVVEACGYSTLWFPEAVGREAFTGAGVLLAGTSTLTVATGIASIYARDAMAANAAARTLAAQYARRFVLGLGVSHRPMVEGVRGHDYSSPLEAMRAYLAAMDTALLFAAEADERPARLLAALGPKMLELAATAADGALPYLVTPEHTSFARGVLGPEPLLCVEQAVVLGADRDEALRRARAHLAIYLGLPNYANNWRRLGFGDDDLTDGGSERLCDALVASGDEQAIARRVQAHVDAGADHVCLQVLPAEARSAPFEEWRRLGQALVAG